MFKRLFVVALFAAAVSAAQPAHASTLTLHSLTCFFQGFVTCVADVSGGTGDYTFYWRMYQFDNQTSSSFQRSSNTIHFACHVDDGFRISVSVTDSAGASTDGKGTTIFCN